jgi:hypothetical protein
MGLGFDPDSFLESNIKPFIQDPGVSKRLVFSDITRAVAVDGSQSKSDVDSETTGIVESDPQMSETLLKKVFPDGEISKEVVKVFFIESDLAFTVINGQTLKIYKYGSSTLLGTYRVKFKHINMVITDVAVAYCVSSK